MFPAMRRCLTALTLSLLAVSSVNASTLNIGKTADKQARYIATYFPGRMTGSPAEMLTAEHLQQQFTSWGYQSNIRHFPVTINYTSADGHTSRQQVTASSVIAARSGTAPQQIIIMAHLDTYTPTSDQDVNHNLGGITLQGIDDNASGLGIMLELAERLSKTPLHYGIRFVATSGNAQGGAGVKNLLARMSEVERKNTLLVIDFDSLIVGERLAFFTRTTMPIAVRKLSLDRAVKLAHQHGIPVIAGNEHQMPAAFSPSGWIEAKNVDEATIPVMLVTALHPSHSDASGHQQRAKSNAFPDGNARHDATRDNIPYLDRWLPRQITHRTHDVMQIMLPLITQLVVTPAAK